VVNALTVLLGGARSGKSSTAVDMGIRYGGPVAYIATAAALDDDMAQRIRHHQDERPPDWHTIEEHVDLIAAIDAAQAVAPDTMTIIDCLTLWTTNLLMQGRSDDEIRSMSHLVATRAAASPTPIIAISNEVGLGVHPDTELGRRYRDVHGWVNQSWTRASGEALFLVAGRVLRLEDPWASGHMRQDDPST
jgi:adenosyl cobinamide kinase/adenosyl cobinamide phosphate guanylyltransferase